MTVTEIKPYKGDTMCVEFAETSENLYIHRSIAVKYMISKGMSLSDSDLKEIRHAQTFRTARERGLYLLDERDYSFKGLFEKLSRNYEDGICLEVCNDLAAQGRINDRKYAAALAEYYSCVKNYGYFRAKQEILKKGISSAAAEDSLAPYNDSAAERLEKLIDDKYLRRIRSRKDLDKVFAALARLGYSYSLIREVFALYDFELDEEY